MNAEPHPAEAEYYVLKRGDTFGPFSHQDLVEGLESAKFAPDDFVQIEHLMIMAKARARQRLQVGERY